MKKFMTMTEITNKFGPLVLIPENKKFIMTVHDTHINVFVPTCTSNKDGDDLYGLAGQEKTKKGESSWDKAVAMFEEAK
jgi:hypothetical protein